MKIVIRLDSNDFNLRKLTPMIINLIYTKLAVKLLHIMLQVKLLDFCAKQAS